MTTQDAYRVFLTRNSEYHVRGGVCFGVRARRTGEFAATHPALGLALAGTFRDALGALSSVHLPLVGERLEFEGHERHLTTSLVLSIEVRDGRGTDALWAQMVSRRSPQANQDTL